MGGDLEILAQAFGKGKNVQRRGRNHDLLNLASAPRRNEGGMVQSPVLGSTSASLRTLTIVLFCSLVAGFILKFPPTKNWRGILVIIEKDLAWWWRCGLGDDQGGPTIVAGECRSRSRDSATGTANFCLSRGSRALSIPTISSSKVHPLLDVPFKIFMVNVAESARRRERDR